MRSTKREETLCNCVLLFFSNVVLKICQQWLSGWCLCKHLADDPNNLMALFLPVSLPLPPFLSPFFSVLSPFLMQKANIPIQAYTYHVSFPLPAAAEMGKRGSQQSHSWYLLIFYTLLLIGILGMSGYCYKILADIPSHEMCGTEIQ